MSDFSVNDFLTFKSGKFSAQHFKYGRFPTTARIADYLPVSWQIPLSGHSAIRCQLRYTAPLVPIKDFEGKP
ncbi:hypothetical protein J4P02_10545 [Pseudomonas sp. NFXW11]|uniref:hypothetical protein n=1 Tax=Pseudomonas sp. NFXW11 TaxID=2819531 RepID=UPI003CF7FADF